MNSADFDKLAELVPDGLLLIGANRDITAANRSAAKVCNCDRALLVGQKLDSVCNNSANELEELLRLFRRGTSEFVGALRLRGREKPTRLFGRLLPRWESADDQVVLLRIPDEDVTLNRFAVLNQKIGELGGEISRRRAAELDLLEQRDLAEFGRDVGLVLADRAGTTEMLGRCTDLMVKHLQAAFARIWILRPGSDELELRASSGMYTNLDGDHSRIRVGQYKIGLIAETQQPHLTNSVIGDERVHNQEWAQREGMIAFAGYPLIVDGRTIGVMAMFARRELSDNCLDAMSTVANSIALGVERKQVEAQLQRHARILKQADRRKDEFLAMLAHELRNPLAPLRSGIELLRLESGDDETLKTMHDQVQHMARLVDDLLDVSRIMRGRIELHCECVRLDEIIDHALRTVRPVIEKLRHELSVSKSTEPIWIDADRVRLAQVVTNLLVNAAKYTPDRGSIRIACSVEGDRAVLEVSDNGVGIEPDFLPDVFELFAQAEHGWARTEGGLGIGLTLVQRLVELHGGRIRVDSAGLGQGSTFTVRLPLASGPEIATAPPTVAESEVSKDCRVLVVDDSPGSAKILRRLLLAIGMENVDLAYDGASAIELAEKFEPNVVFLDIGLPGMDGFEVARHLRGGTRFVSTRLIALTGYGTEEDRQKSRDAGFDEHLVKPVSLEQLKQALAVHAKNAT